MEARTYQAYIFGDDPEAGQAVDRDVRQRMEAKGVSYSDALRGRLREFRELLDYAEPINSPGVAIDAIAKDLQRRKKISYSEALRRAIAGNPTLGRGYIGVAATYEVKDGDPTPASIDEVVATAKRAAGVARIPLRDAVRQILEGEPAVAQKTAGDWLDHKALVEINNQNLGSSIDRAYPAALAIVKRAYPEVDRMYQTGRVSELAMKTIFRQWFRD